jgi:hypothetical protein
MIAGCGSFQSNPGEGLSMHRRDLLKAFAVIPITSTLLSCEKKDDDSSHAETLEIHLDGAIALVMQENKGNSLLAFSPRPKAGDEPHLFSFNGSRKAETPEKPLHFKLSVPGREGKQKPEINPGLNDFFFKTERWRVGDSLVTIELPAPDRITFSGHRTSVNFSADHRQAWMPLNHILKYDLKKSSQTKLECSQTSLRCDPSSDSYPGVTRFFFEIGPKQTLDYEQARVHAVRFFNYILQQSFPDLEKRFSLLEPYPGRDKQTRIFNPRLEPAVFQYGSPEGRLQPASYVVDCEFAGPLVSTRTPPQG